MTPGNDDREPLIKSFDDDDKKASISHANTQYQEHIAIRLVQPKNYGSLSAVNKRGEERLTYTWYNLDVFAEVPNAQGSVFRTVCKRSRELICREKRIPAPRKQLLKNVFGVAYPGELLAVMGSSGAGKSTLLNALAFRSPQGVQVSPSAVRLLNGCPVDTKQMRARCAYVQQDDLFISSLTAREHLIFQAMLRMPRHSSYRQKVERVNQVIQELSLTKCQNTLIGEPGRIKGLSGGERKRLAFASEALTDPPLLLCDEPTSGLDSFMAHSVLQVLKGLSEKGKTIIVTIHQPSSEIFTLFDRLMLMAEGRVAFLGTPNQAADFFAQLGTPCPPNYNPADFYVQMLAIAPSKEIESREKVGKICDCFAVGAVAKDMSQLFQKNKNQSQLVLLDEESILGYKASWCTQLRAVLWRSWLTVLKEPLLVKVRLLQTLIIALLIGIIFYGQELTQDGVMNINGAIFLFLTNMTFQNAFAVITVFCSELPVFMRESRSRLYRCSTYFLGKTLSEMPLFLAVPFIFTSIVYPMIGLRPGVYHYLVSLALVSLVANVATSFGYLVSCFSSSTSMALSVGPPLIIPFLLFGGFLLNEGSIPEYLKWLSYLSWFRYGNEGLLVNQWADVKPGEIACTRSNTTCPASGQVILETLNFSSENLIWDNVGLVLLIIGFRFVAYLGLVMRARSSD